VYELDSWFRRTRSRAAWITIRLMPAASLTHSFGSLHSITSSSRSTKLLQSRYGFLIVWVLLVYAAVLDTCKIPGSGGGVAEAAGGHPLMGVQHLQLNGAHERAEIMSACALPGDCLGALCSTNAYLQHARIVLMLQQRARLLAPSCLWPCQRRSQHCVHRPLLACPYKQGEQPSRRLSRNLRLVAANATVSQDCSAAHHTCWVSGYQAGHLSSAC
jgi:hypothetical protein